MDEKVQTGQQPDSKQKEEVQEGDNFAELRRAQLQSRPVIVCPLHLKTLTCQKVAARTIPEMNRALYVVVITLRVQGLEEAANLIETQIEQLTEELVAELEDDRRRMTKLIEDNSVETQMRYTKPIDIEAEVSTPAAARYLGLIEQADRMLQLVDRLWMANLMKDHVRLNKCYEWERRFIKHKNRVLELSNRARRGINRKRNGQEQTLESFVWQGAPEQMQEETVAQEQA